MLYDKFDKQISDFMDKKINSKGLKNRRDKQEIYRNGAHKIECIIVNDYLEFWVNNVKFWNINPSTNEIKFFGNIDFSDCNVTGLGETPPEP